MKFSINPQIFEKWPSAKLGVAVVFGLKNSTEVADINNLLQKIQEEKKKEFEGKNIKEENFIFCWREAYKNFGSSPKKYPSSIEALLERVVKGGKLPNINPLVNLYNYLSLKYLLPFGGEDLDEIKGNVELTLAKGDEKGKYIGGDKEDSALKEEVIYKDEKGFICRRWNWREADRTKFTKETKNAVLVAEIISPEFENQLKESIEELSDLNGKYLGGEMQINFLDKNNPEINFEFTPQSKNNEEVKNTETIKTRKQEEKQKEKNIFLPLKNSFAEKLQNAVWETVQNYDIPKEEIFLEHPEVESFGDYSCNIAMRLSKTLKKNPMSIAEEIKEKISVDQYNGNDRESVIEKVEVKAPGFINFWLKKEALLEAIEKPYEFARTGKKVMVEFTDPNPFKEFHIGHLYSNTVGEVLARLNEYLGHDVKRACYQGDVGMHVAKSLFGLMRKMTDEKINPQDLEKKSLKEKQKIMGDSYVLGSKLYDEDETAKNEMNLLNKKIYEKDPSVFELYQKGREWSLEYFESVYSRLGMEKRGSGKSFDNYYFESEVGKIGQKIVEENLSNNIFEKSEGAIIFPGKKYGLHNRVFINSLGLPTYEAKELGLAVKKFEDFPYDLSIPVTGNEINEYFKVLMKALSLIRPELEKKTIHVGHGMVKLPSGKMSSRTGDIITGQWLLDEVKKQVKENYKCDEETAEKVGLSAVKYALLKSGLGKDVIFDLDKSIAIEGNSGPYLMYTLVRTKSIITKIPNSNSKIPNNFSNFNQEEISLLRTLYKLPEVIQAAAAGYAPNLLCNFLYELAQKFNTFYGKHRIIDEDRVNEFRLFLTKNTGEILEKGMKILNLPIVEKM